MTILNEFASKKLLEDVGINIAKGFIAEYGSGYIAIETILESIGTEEYVLKIVSPDIVHKSDVGGVILNVPMKYVSREMNKMIDNIVINQSDARIQGIYIEEMVKPGIECIIGIKDDPQFGKVIIFGFGGIYTEVFKDISMRILPITVDDAHEMITETKIYKILSGVRGKQYDIDAIIDTILKVCIMSEKYNIIELDINPLVVHEKGCKVLDARIMT